MDKRIIEGIEACRPQSDDLLLPELCDVARQVEQDPAVRARYARTQKFDAAVRATIEDVPVPEALADKILARLGVSTAPAHAAEPAVDVATRPAVAEVSRRRWLAVSLTIAAGLLLATLAVRWMQPDDEVPFETLAEQWGESLKGWQDLHRHQAPADFAVPGAMLAAPTGWQRLPHQDGVAYQLENAKGDTAILYVVRLSRTDLPTSPPDPPQSTSGKAVGYWHSGGRVYVLVVPGDERSYRTFVSSSPLPLA